MNANSLKQGDVILSPTLGVYLTVVENSGYKLTLEESLSLYIFKYGDKEDEDFCKELTGLSMS